MGLLDTIAPTPRNKLLGLLADAAQGVSDFAARPFGYDNPPGAIVASLLGVPDVAKTLDRLSYGEPLTTGSGMTLRPREEAVNAAMAALPLGATLGKGAIDAGVYAAQKAAPAIERVVPRIMKRGGLPAEILRGMSQQTVSPLTVWHGSPHKFDKFDASKIGTGEGAQAYGYGLYLAESPDVAGSYAANLTTKPVRINGKSVEEVLTDPNAQRFMRDANGDLELAKKLANDEWIRYKKIEPSATMRGYVEDAQSQLNSIDPSRVSIERPGSLYKVDLPDEHIAKMLDWDKPLSEQHPDVVSFARAEGADLDKAYGGRGGDGENLIKLLRQKYGDEGASQALQQAGIPGIRYLDGGSRGTGAGTSNFVVFPGNEKILKILERNGKPVGLLGN